MSPGATAALRRVASSRVDAECVPGPGREIREPPSESGPRDPPLPGRIARADPRSAAPASPTRRRYDARRGDRNPTPPRARLLNRELSWLDFNARVLALAEDADRPLLERAKFLAIFASNLDEFVQVRVSGLQEQVAGGDPHPLARRDGPAPAAPGDQRADGRARHPSRRALHQGDRARARGRRHRLLEVGRARRRRPRVPRRGLRGQCLPGAHAARGRPGAPLPLHLEPLAQPRRRRARPRDAASSASHG